MKKVYLNMPWNLPEHQKAVDIKITHVNRMVMSHLSALTALYQYLSREYRKSHMPFNFILLLCQFTRGLITMDSP